MPDPCTPPFHYTTTRENRELRQQQSGLHRSLYYTTTRENRELRREVLTMYIGEHYTTTRENRELRPLPDPCTPPFHYTTTRENRELRQQQSGLHRSLYYTTTRENRELRRIPCSARRCGYYTTTRENRELRLSGEEMRYMTNYTTTRENWELRQCDHIEEINFHHIVILAAAEGRACEGRIKRKKGNTGTVLNMENISPQVTSEAPQRANVSFHNILSQESGVKASGGSHCRFDIFPAIFFLLLVEMAFYGIINL